MLGEILRGIGSGATYALSMYSKKQNTVFDWNKFITTLIVGGIAGAGISVVDMPIGAMYEYIIALGIVPLVENIYRFIQRKIYPKILNLFS